jgi:hypothetical protein
MRRITTGSIIIGLVLVAAGLAATQVAQAAWTRLAAVGFEAVGDHACTDGITFRLSDLRLPDPPFRTYTANHVVITSTSILTPEQIADQLLAPIPENPIKADLDGFGNYEDYGYSGYYTVRWSTAQISGNSVQLDFQDEQLDKPEVPVVNCVVDDLPEITTQPANRVVDAGQTATLSVVAQGAGTLSYQWYEGVSGDTTTPVGTNSADFTTPALSANTSYWVRVSGDFGSVDSNTTTVTIASEHVYLPLMVR